MSGKKIKLPIYDDRKGWHKADSHALYHFTDRRTKRTFVAPGDSLKGIGPEVDVRLASRSEGEALWQNPLNPSWKVADDYSAR